MSESNPLTPTEGAAQTAPSSPWGVQNTTDTHNLSAAGMSDETSSGFSLLQPFQEEVIPLKDWVDHFVDWIVTNLRGFFMSVKAPIEWVLSSIEHGMSAIPPLILIGIIALIAWQMAGKKLAIGTVISLIFLGLIGIWDDTVITLSLVLTSVFFCMLIGIPLGIAMARHRAVERIVRPLLDAMQTTPAFVYLVPIVMLFSIGNVSGVIVTIIFAVPPVIRLTCLGIRQVPEDLIEAAHSFGADRRQMLFKVQLPLAMPTIMAGVNQTLMLSLSMVVIASMISVPGLGLTVLRGIGRLDIGLATVGGVGIVVLAIILDRMTQSLGQNSRDNTRWYQTGPAGLVWRLTRRKNTEAADVRA